MPTDTLYSDTLSLLPWGTYRASAIIYLTVNNLTAIDNWLPVIEQPNNEQLRVPPGWGLSLHRQEGNTYPTVGEATLMHVLGLSSCSIMLTTTMTASVSQSCLNKPPRFLFKISLYMDSPDTLSLTNILWPRLKHHKEYTPLCLDVKAP
jgi:hypothetical protein